MHAVKLVAALGLSTIASAAPLETRNEAGSILADLQAQAMENLRKAEANGTLSKRDGSCNILNAQVRRDWAAFSTKERKEYIAAVQCLLTSPSKSDPSFAPGARNRYDDFVAVHIDQTRTIHGTGNFLTWHRYYVWAYENALKTECGYKGAQPYWNWFAHTDDPRKSPVFDGSDTSLSGDGEYVPHNGSVSLAPNGNIEIPSGHGGGCVASGPLVNMTVNLGPVSPGMDGLDANPNGPMAHNPRCLRRDLSVYTASTWHTPENLLNVTIGRASGSIASFQNELQGRFGDGFLGMHAAGHFVASGDASDLFSSPADPSFFLHHAMVDRVYWLWQALHLWGGAAFEIAGTITIQNMPPSRNATKDDVIEMGVLAQDRSIGELLNTIDGSPLCYIYL
ncbi:FAD binding domain containing protein [Colletotrichum musicola]|uniref:FAD binding domain containing protein n=1 Tax=Colletotrichum musicola TaxID=2175873 RepID=A0A8H6J558_9PEZI|nr:FAD binding domain containing protein [Colletotrichum musicola]